MTVRAGRLARLRGIANEGRRYGFGLQKSQRIRLE